MKISAFSFNPFGEMTYVVWDEVSRQAAVIDPGMIDENEQKAFDDFITRNNLSIKYIVNTHLHLDHVFGAKYLQSKYGTELWANPADAPLGATMSDQPKRFHLPVNLDNVAIDHHLVEGDTLTLGNEKLEVIETPGHSPGSICLYSPEGGFLISGDTLFRRGVGRTDLPGGSAKSLSDSIRNKLYRLPAETLVCPGHGPTTTIGDEIKSNPYV